MPVKEVRSARTRKKTKKIFAVQPFGFELSAPEPKGGSLYWEGKRHLHRRAGETGTEMNTKNNQVYSVLAQNCRSVDLMVRDFQNLLKARGKKGGGKLTRANACKAGKRTSGREF